MMLTENTLEELLSYMEKSMNNLVNASLANLELGEEFSKVENFLQNQFDIRVENLLIVKNSGIHHLESKMKNKVIQRKQKILEQITKEYKN